MRKVGNLTVSTPSDREILITREFDASRSLVFDAFTKPELLKRWLTGPPGWSLSVCEIELRVGGAYRYVWQRPNGNSMGMGGVYREIVRPERIVATELFDEDWTGGEVIGTVVFTEQSGKTKLIQTLLYQSRDARDAVLRTPMAEGMSAGYDQLAELLASLGAKGEA